MTWRSSCATARDIFRRCRLVAEKCTLKARKLRSSSENEEKGTVSVRTTKRKRGRPGRPASQEALEQGGRWDEKHGMKWTWRTRPAHGCRQREPWPCRGLAWRGVELKPLPPRFPFAQSRAQIPRYVTPPSLSGCPRRRHRHYKPPVRQLCTWQSSLSQGD